MLFLHHTEAPESGAVIIEARGPLNSNTAPSLEDYITRLIEKDRLFLIIDAGGIDHVSSEGIGLVLLIQRKLTSRNGFLILCNLPAEIANLYAILGFDRVLTLCSSREEAENMMEKQVQMRAAGHEMPQAPEGGLSTSVSTDLDVTSTPLAAAPHAEEFGAPLIVECSSCKGLVRVKSSGAYQCPHCLTRFSVESDQTIIF